MLPADVLTIREIGDTTHPYWTAASADGSQLLLEPGESALWVGRCKVSQLRPDHWEFPDPITLVVTDRRSAFFTTAFDKGGGWSGFGPVGLAFAVTANVVSQHRASQRSAGRVAIGQVRHEWLTELSVRHPKGLLGRTNTLLDLTVACSTGPRLIEVNEPRVVHDAFAGWLAGLVAWQRLTLPVPRSTEETERLRQYQQAGPPTELRWTFPGDTESLIAEATQT